MPEATGTNLVAGVTQYATNVRFRAWGALKSLSYGNSKTLSIGYNNLLQATSYEVPGILKKSYQYYNDGRVQFTQDQLTTNSKFDRLYDYDHAGRVITALTGAEARGQGATDDRPYKETLTYDPLNHLTRIDGRNWDAPSGIGPHTYLDDRNTAWTYDADGRMLIGPSGYFNFDAAGKVYSFSDGGDDKTDQKFDGDGRRAKAVHNVFNDQTDQWELESTTYFVSSSVLGGKVVSELNTEGAKQSTFVYANGSVLASQTVTDSTESVAWRHVDTSGASVRTTDAAGQWTVGLAELDAVGANTGLIKPIVWTPPNHEGKLMPYLGFGDINSPGGGCVVDGIEGLCDIATGGATVPCPPEGCRSLNLRTNRTEEFRAYADGRSGNVPLDASYLGDGRAYSTSTASAGGHELAGVIDLDRTRNSFGGNPQESGYPGGSPNPIAQLAPCSELDVPGFDKVNSAGATLLQNTYGKYAQLNYNDMSTYDKAVFLNTAAAAASVGVNLSNAKLDSLLYSTKSETGNLPYGIYVTGAMGKLEKRHKDIASVQLSTDKGLTKIEVDLFRGTGWILSDLRRKHDQELDFNSANKRPTHPGDVSRQLAKREVNSGVSCK